MRILKRLFPIAVLFVTSGCAMPGETLHFLYNDVGRSEFRHQRYTEAQVNSSRLFVEIEALDQNEDTVVFWTSFPLSELASLKAPSEYKYPRAGCSTKRYFAIFRNPAIPSNPEGFGFADFKPIQLGELPKDGSDQPRAVQSTMLVDVIEEPDNIKRYEYNTINWGEDIPKLTQRLSSNTQFEMLFEQRESMFLFAVPEAGDQGPSSVYLMSGPSICINRYARREWWSYPAMVVGTPFALASDILLVPVLGLRAVLLLAVATVALGW